MSAIRPESERGDGEAHGGVAPGEPPDIKGTAGPTAEIIFEILSNRRRRNVLQYLKQIDGPVTMRDLSEQLTAWETGKDRTAIRPSERKRVYTALHQNHLPRMDQAGVIEYDRDRGTVVRTAEFAAYAVYLEATPGRNRNWGLFYVGLGVALAGVVAASALGLPPFSAVPVVAWSGLSAAAVVVSGVAQLLLDDRSGAGNDGSRRMDAKGGTLETDAPTVGNTDRP